MSAPSGTVGTLTFPVLASPACTAPSPRADVCYESFNDISGLNVNAVSLEDSVNEVGPHDIVGDYFIRGKGFTLGAGGLTATSHALGFQAGAAILELPITLGASQTWSIDGGGGSGGRVVDSGGLTGTSAALGLVLSNHAQLEIPGGVNDEVGAITIKGGNPSFTGAAAGENGSVVVEGFEGASLLNATDGNSVHLEDAEIVGQNGTIGALTSTGGSVLLSAQGSPFAVAGGVTLDSASLLQLRIIGPGTVPGSNYSQLSATGSVNVGNAQLSIFAAEGSCSPLHVGDVDTLVTTTGSRIGAFSGLPDGSTMSLEGCEGEPPIVKINYTAQTVTATVVAAGKGAKETEEAAAKKHQEEEAAARKHQEEVAASKKHEEEAAAQKRHEEEAATTVSVSLKGSILKVQGARKVAVKLTCAGNVTCSGKLTLTANGKGKKKTIGTATFSIAAGKTATVTLTLNRTGRALLGAAHGRLSATLMTLKVSPSPSTTHAQSVHLVAIQKR